MRPAPVTIRPATPTDAPFAAPLIQATIGPIGWALTGTPSDAEAAEVIEQLFPLSGHRLSFERVRVAERDGRPLGLLLAYPGAAAELLDQPLRARLRALGQADHIEQEGTPGELYLDTLAVSEAARNQGIGAQLLAAAAVWARELGLPRLGLLAQDGNPAARLYERSGFVVAGHRTLAGGHYTHLTRDLPPTAPSE
ncbi:GNAT family N-acetyltransferase [Deinococcus sp. HMF7604]|uniref:GNAT family N-acetyltransferase n=1 Tax=Deinococcus betulae TaxID=2873312 RepID=UPI001CCDED50|nr:GNAT family N-acetyltransferase [Deinococcus betulae]MBZ9751998.1 GNAT family N-acetyltransferase [Deinococcus betulae]